MKLINSFFLYAGFILIFINTVLYLMGYKQNKKALAYKFFTVYLIISFIISVSAFILAKQQIPNLHLSHAYFIGQFVLLSFFYWSLFKLKQKPYVLITMMIVIVLLAIQYSLKPHLIDMFNLFEIFITSFPLVVYAIVHLYNSLNKTNNYLFINAGILIFITSSTLIFILGNVMGNAGMSNAVRNIYMINKILYVVYLTLILIQWKTSFRPIKSKL